jgi:chemotaxis signal transduction protein
MATRATSEDVFIILEFGGEQHAFSLSSVRSVVPLEEMRAADDASLWIRGWVSNGGHSLPVFDLSVASGKAPQPIPPGACILLVEVGTQPPVVGILANLASFRLVQAEADAAAPGGGEQKLWTFYSVAGIS